MVRFVLCGCEPCQNCLSLNIAYANLQGDGTCFANAENTFPWINHTEQGQVWSTGASKANGSF